MSSRVAYLLGSLNRGGTETLLLDVIRNAKKNDLDAITIYRKSGALENDFLESGMPVLCLSPGKNPIRYILHLRKLLLKNKIELTHAQQPVDALYACIATYGTDIKCILSFHGYDFNEKGISKLILRYIIKKTNLNIFVSETQKRYYVDKYTLKATNQKVVYNGISFDKLDNAVTQPTTLSHRSSSIKLREELQLSHNTLLLGSVGNFNAVRSQITICRFLKLLNEYRIDFRFIFVGKRIESNSELYDTCVDFCITNKLNDKVTFLGVRDDVPTILTQLDAFIYSTDHDTFGIAVVEAMAVGIPVFVNDWGVMTEITEVGKYATLYKTKDERDLLRYFLLFLHDKQAFQEKAKEASVYVRHKFSIEMHIHQLKDLYSSLFNSHNL